MKLLETARATIEFEIVEEAHRDTDPRLVDAVRQNERLRHVIHEAPNEIMAHAFRRACGVELLKTEIFREKPQRNRTGGANGIRTRV